MSKEYVKDVVIECLQHHTNVKVTEEASFKDLQLDSLDVVAVGIDIETRLFISINDEIFATINTVAELIKTVEKIVKHPVENTEIKAVTEMLKNVLVDAKLKAGNIETKHAFICGQYEMAIADAISKLEDIA